MRGGGHPCREANQSNKQPELNVLLLFDFLRGLPIGHVHPEARGGKKATYVSTKSAFWDGCQAKESRQWD